MLNHFQAELDELVIRHRGLGFVHILVKHLCVLNRMLSTGSHRNDVVQRSCVRFQRSPRQRTAMLLVLKESQHIACAYWARWARLVLLALRMYLRFTRGR